MNLVTLIIPTYNRPKLLYRILDYYNGFHISFKIIVADSSDPSIKKINRNIIKSFPSLNILYLDKFSPRLVSHHKFAQMVEFVKTKYCVFCADDDFIIPNGIAEAVKFLEKNPDYVTAHGTYISFYISPSVFNKKKFLWKFIYPYHSIISSKAEDRLASHLVGYEQVLYAVRKTNIVKICYKEYLKSKADPILFGELLPDMLTLIYGKMKRINTFYAARQAFSSAVDYWPSLYDAKKEGTYNNEYLKFRSCLASNLIKISNISKEKAEELIDIKMQIYLKSSIQQHIFGKIYSMLNYFPKLIHDGFRILHALYLFSKEKDDRIGSINKPTSKYFMDFEKLKTSTLNN